MIAENAVAIRYSGEKALALEIVKQLPRAPENVKASSTFYDALEQRLTVLVEFVTPELKAQWLDGQEGTSLEIDPAPAQEYLDGLTGP